MSTIICGEQSCKHQEDGVCKLEKVNPQTVLQTSCSCVYFCPITVKQETEEQNPKIR